MRITHFSLAGDISDASLMGERPISDVLMVSSEGLLEIENLFFNSSWADPSEE